MIDFFYILLCVIFGSCALITLYASVLGNEIKYRDRQRQKKGEGNFPQLENPPAAPTKHNHNDSARS